MALGDERLPAGFGDSVSPVLTRKLKMLGLICAFMAGVGTMYQLVGPDPVDPSGPLVGAILGLAFGLMELFALATWGRRLASLAFLPLVAAKATLYTLVVFATSHAMGFIYGYVNGLTLHDFWMSMLDPENWTHLFFFWKLI